MKGSKAVGEKGFTRTTNGSEIVGPKGPAKAEQARKGGWKFLWFSGWGFEGVQETGFFSFFLSTASVGPPPVIARPEGEHS